MATWLRPGGWMSNEIDFRCHKLTRDWNGHWACDDFTWKILRGRKPYLLNRQPCSAHVHLIEKYGCRVVGSRTTSEAGGLSLSQLAGEWRGRVAQSDLSCAT